MCVVEVVTAKLEHLKHLSDDACDVATAPCLPADVSEAEWGYILNCSYFDMNLSDASNISVEDAAGDDDDDDDADDEINGDGGEIGVGGEDEEGVDEPGVDGGVEPAGDGVSSGKGSSSQAKAHEDGENATVEATSGGLCEAPPLPAETAKARAERFRDVKATELTSVRMGAVQALLAEVAARGRQHTIDGCANIWILKPGGKSRGRGIRCINKLDAARHLFRSTTSRTRVGLPAPRWVVQKYIENPIIIQRRKFDIRQWVLVKDWNPLTAYFYDVCYLRFAAEEYSLADFENRFGHLTNNSVAVKSGQFEEGATLPQRPASTSQTPRTVRMTAIQSYYSFAA